MFKKLFFFLIPLVLILSHLARKVTLWYQTKLELKQMTSTIQRLEKENQELERKNQYYQSDAFISREARGKLGMVKENEVVFVMPTIPDLSQLKVKGESYEQIPVWKQWQRLLFAKEE